MAAKKPTLPAWMQPLAKAITGLSERAYTLSADLKRVAKEKAGLEKKMADRDTADAHLATEVEKLIVEAEKALKETEPKGTT